jgi:hypothetical protein
MSRINGKCAEIRPLNQFSRLLDPNLLNREEFEKPLGRFGADIGNDRGNLE